MSNQLHPDNANAASWVVRQMTFQSLFTPGMLRRNNDPSREEVIQVKERNTVLALPLMTLRVMKPLHYINVYTYGKSKNSFVNSSEGF